MSPEAEKPKEPKGPLLPGHRLLFPNPGFLYGAAGKLTQEQMGISRARFKDLDKDLFRQNTDNMFTEYIWVLDVLSKHVDRRNITIVKNKVVTLKENPKTLGYSVEDIECPDIEEYENVGLNASDPHGTIWLRDRFMTIGGVSFLNPEAFPYFKDSDDAVKSFLGEGGAVLTAGNAVLVSEDLWRIRKQDPGFAILQRKGFICAPLPPIDPKKQKYDSFNKSHIDGHAALIIDKDGILRLLVAESYSRQGHKTREVLRFAAETVGAEMGEIDDANLPPLALNLIQFKDGSVVASSGETNDLTFVLELLLGKDKVLQTEVPLIRIPSILAGGIRCMTNTLPTSLLRKLETLV